MDFIRTDNHENPQLESEEFPFRLFLIQKSETPSHWHNHREIFYLKKGTCTVYIDGSVTKCLQGDILFLPPGSLHSYITDQSAEYYAIVIGTTLFNSMENDNHVKEIISGMSHHHLLIRPSDSIYGEFKKPVESIIVEENKRERGFELIIKLEICRLYSQMKRNSPHQVKKIHPEANMSAIKMKRVLEYISNHFSEKITISVMARFSHLSNQHFCRIFKSYTGKTLIEFLTELRLEQADFLIKKTDLPITGIPELTGFCNGNYFARVYKKKYGHPPSLTRKNSVFTS